MNVFTSVVMAALVAATHAHKRQRGSWVAGTSPAMTEFALIQAKPKELYAAFGSTGSGSDATESGTTTAAGLSLTLDSALIAAVTTVAR